MTSAIPVPVADPDLQLRGWGGLDLLAMAATFPSVISSFFTPNKGGRAPRAPPLDPPLGAVLYQLSYLYDLPYIHLFICTKSIFTN